MTIHYEDILASRKPVIYCDGSTTGRACDGNLLWLVSWVGYQPENNTWEPVASLDGAIESVRAWQKLNPHKPQLPESEIRAIIKKRDAEDRRRGIKI